MSKKVCEPKHSTVERETLIKQAVRKERLGDVVVCEHCNKDVCKSHKARHLTTCKGKAKQDKVIVEGSTSSASVDDRIVQLEYQIARQQKEIQQMQQMMMLVCRDQIDLVRLNNINQEDKETPHKNVDEEIKAKKNKLNKQMRARCWVKYVGEDVARTKCLCCQEQMITTFSFECGHVEAHACGGSNDLSNLRPICRDCNNGMGTQNMKEYAKEMFGVIVI
jgi:hypothetical protein